MLVLTRRTHERLFIGDSIIVSIERIDHGQVRIGVEAPRDVSIIREELAIRDGRGGEARR